MQAIENIINHALKLDPNAAYHLKKLSGTCLKVEITGLFSFYIVFEESSIIITQASLLSTPLVVRGSIPAFIKLVLSKNPQAAARLGLSFEGDHFILEMIQQFLFSLQIDWEEAVAQKTGDIFANKLGNFVQGFKKVAQKKLTHATRDFKEYLTEEIKILPTRAEIEIFLDELDSVRKDLDRLEIRIGMLC